MDKGNNEGQRPVGLAGLFMAFMAGFGLAPSRRSYVPRGPLPAPIAPADVAPQEAASAPAALAVAPEVEAVQPVALPALEVVALQQEPMAEQAPARAVPTPLGGRVLLALQDQAPLRKYQVAALVGIGRGSANRIIDRLAAAGWLREQDGHFTLA